MTPFRRARAGLLLTLALGLGLCAAGHAAPPRPGPVPVGERLADLRLSGLNGPDQALSRYFGRRLIINVWASWCGPCRAEAASLERFAWSEPGQAYTVIGISTDDDRAAAQRWLTRSRATLPHFIDRELAMETQLGASHIPLTVLVDEAGRVRARIEGARDWTEPAALALIERAFKAKPRP